MKTSDHPFLYDRRISADAVYRFLDRCIKQKIDLHAFTIYRDQELVARISLAPYDCIADKRQVYSASKSFTATGIGFAVQEGLLTVEDRVIDFFPDRLREDAGKAPAFDEYRPHIRYDAGFARAGSQGNRLDPPVFGAAG